MQRSAQAGRKGLTEDKYEGLLNFTTSDKFSEREKVALTYTSAIVWNSEIADDMLWESCTGTSRSRNSSSWVFSLVSRSGNSAGSRPSTSVADSFLAIRRPASLLPLLSGCARQPRNRSRKTTDANFVRKSRRRDAFHSPRGFPTIPREEEFFSQNYQAIKGQ